MIFSKPTIDSQKKAVTTYIKKPQHQRQTRDQMNTTSEMTSELYKQDCVTVALVVNGKKISKYILEK